MSNYNKDRAQAECLAEEYRKKAEIYYEEGLPEQHGEMLALKIRIQRLGFKIIESLKFDISAPGCTSRVSIHRVQ